MPMIYWSIHDSIDWALLTSRKRERSINNNISYTNISFFRSYNRSLDSPLSHRSRCTYCPCFTTPRPHPPYSFSPLIVRLVSCNVEWNKLIRYIFFIHMSRFYSMLPGCTLLFYLSYEYIVYVLRTYGIMYKYIVCITCSPLLAHFTYSEQSLPLKWLLLVIIIYVLISSVLQLWRKIHTNESWCYYVFFFLCFFCIFFYQLFRNYFFLSFAKGYIQSHAAISVLFFFFLRFSDSVIFFILEMNLVPTMLL